MRRIKSEQSQRESESETLVCKMYEHFQRRYNTRIVKMEIQHPSE